MKWTFEQKLAWAKAYIAGEFVPIPTGFSGTLKGWHDRVKRWANVLLEYGEEGLNPSRHSRSFSPEFKLAAVERVLSGEPARAVAYSLGMPCPRPCWRGCEPIEKRASMVYSVQQIGYTSMGRFSDASIVNMGIGIISRIICQIEMCAQ